jgi:hypothetical protein
MAFNAGFSAEDAGRVDDHGTQISCRRFRDGLHVDNMLVLGRGVKPTGCSCGRRAEELPTLGWSQAAFGKGGSGLRYCSEKWPNWSFFQQAANVQDILSASDAPEHARLFKSQANDFCTQLRLLQSR